MSSITVPAGWSADEIMMEDYAETTFAGELCGLPGPFKAIMFREPNLDDQLLVQCGGAETEERTDLPLYVFWYPISSEVKQITKPTKLEDILAMMKNSTTTDTAKVVLETKRLVMGGLDAREPYMPIPSGWLAVDKSADRLLDDFPADLYDFLPPHQPALRTVQGDLIVIRTREKTDLTYTDDDGKTQPAPPSSITILWHKPSNVVKEFRQPSDEDEIAHFLCKEQREYGTIVWSKKYFRLDAIELKAIEGGPEMPNQSTD